MAPPIDPVGPGGVRPIGPQPRPITPQPQGQSFKDVLYESLGEVNRLQQEATQATENLLTGKTENVGHVLAATQKADVAFKMLMEIRTKLVAAYDELRQMRV